jgi:hypothetical protein
MANETITISINQLVQDCKITPRDAGNGKLEIDIEFPSYFNLLPLETQTRIVNTIQEVAASGALDQK